MIKRIAAVFLSIVMSLTLLSPVRAEALGAEDASLLLSAAPVSSGPSYDDYLKEHGNPAGKLPSAEITISAADVLPGDAAFITSYAGRDAVLYLDVPESSCRWNFSVEEAGYYQLAFTFAGISDKSYDIIVDLKLDGEVPYENTENLKLRRTFLDETYLGPDDNNFRTNLKGDELMPSVIEQIEWQTQTAMDAKSLYSDPLLYYLDKGTHEIELTLKEEAFALSSMTFSNPASSKSYAAVKAGWDAAGAADSHGQSLTFEAEKSYYKNDVTLFATYDTAYVHVTPASPENIFYNTIGKNTWKEIGQEISWEFEVPESGYYHLAFKAKQYDKTNAFSARRVTIDGESLCAEADDQKFEYRTGWYVKPLTDEGGNAMKVFLPAGRHVLGMTAVIDPEMAALLRGVSETQKKLQDWYREIIRITGFNADAERITIDANRDFNLETVIPGLLDGFTECKAELDKYYGRVGEIEGISQSSASILKELSSLLASLLKRPKRIVKNIETLRSDISTLATWVIDMQDQPLTLDKFFVYSPDVAVPSVGGGFFAQLWYRLKMFFHSFNNTASSITGTQETDASDVTLRVWISTADITTTGASSGRDQAIILKKLIDESFTDKYGVNVDVSLVNGSGTLVQAVLAGEGPDIALFTSTDTPVNLAMRGALLELSQFDGFDEITKEFTESALTPFWYKDGCYALPETQNFNLLFYRSDVYEELGLTPPKTWDEFYEQIILLSNANYMVGVPQNQNTFETFLYQSGQHFYTDDFSASTFNTEEALTAFRSWTGLYTKYSLSLIFDFFNRFRSGELAIGIMPYNQVNYLYSAAPELNGLWDCAVMPGTVQPDGSINNVETCSSTGCVALADTEHPQEAFDFLKWWVSSDTQAAFGVQVEQTLGIAARYGTANIKAFEEIPWTASQAAVMRAQRDATVAIEQIPGNYYIARNLSFAFRAVVYNNANSRSTLYRYNIEINKELARKQKEFSY